MWFLQKVVFVWRLHCRSQSGETFGTQHVLKPVWWNVRYLTCMEASLVKRSVPNTYWSQSGETFGTHHVLKPVWWNVRYPTCIEACKTVVEQDRRRVAEKFELPIVDEIWKWFNQTDTAWNVSKYGKNSVSGHVSHSVNGKGVMKTILWKTVAEICSTKNRHSAKICSRIQFFCKCENLEKYL